MALDLLYADPHSEEARPSKRRCLEQVSGRALVHNNPHGSQVLKDFPPAKGQHPQKESLDFKCSARSTNQVVTKRCKDAEDGRFDFTLGESLTPRCNDLSYKELWFREFVYMQPTWCRLQRFVYMCRPLADKIIRKMGQGTFGQVLECWDRDAHEAVAIKVIRSVKKYREAAMTEIDVLFRIGKDKIGARGCVQIRRWFEYQNHICIVFEKLGPSLFDFLEANDFHPFTVNTARRICRQLLESVAYIHSLKYIHTDLKPENILLMDSEYTKVLDSKLRVPRSSNVKLIDFGSTVVNKKHSSSIVSTRHYRAPEVILGLGWSYPCDIWSVGCILIELCSGELLFDTHENIQHLAMMERILGPIPPRLSLNSTGEAVKYFNHKQNLDWPKGASSSKSVRVVQKLLPLEDFVAKHAGYFTNLLTDLLRGLLKYNPEERLTAKEALSHAFFR